MPDEAVTRPRGVVAGTVWQADGTPFVRAFVALRSMDDGHEAKTVKTDAQGRFRFEAAPSGIWIVEIRSAEDQLLAVSDPVAVASGQEVTLTVRTRARALWDTRFSRNTGAAVVSDAASAGITAMGSNGLPATPR